MANIRRKGGVIGNCKNEAHGGHENITEIWCRRLKYGLLERTVHPHRARSNRMLEKYEVQWVHNPELIIATWELVMDRRLGLLRGADVTKTQRHAVSVTRWGTRLSAQIY